MYDIFIRNLTDNRRAVCVQTICDLIGISHYMDNVVDTWIRADKNLAIAEAAYAEAAQATGITDWLECLAAVPENVTRRLENARKECDIAYAEALERFNYYKSLAKADEGTKYQVWCKRFDSKEWLPYSRVRGTLEHANLDLLEAHRIKPPATFQCVFQVFYSSELDGNSLKLRFE